MKKSMSSNLIRFCISALGVVLLMSTVSVSAAESKADSKADAPKSLEDQLQSLNMANQGPSSVSYDKLYSVQSRYSPLKNRNEVMVGGASDLTGDSFLNTSQLSVGYRRHFNDRIAVAFDHDWVMNEFNSTATKLRDTDGAIPNLPYAMTRTDLMFEYNVFYGKFRVSSEQVFYFDQYLALGPGLIVMNNGNFGAVVADVGFAFWLGKWGSARLGLKDYYYDEAYPSGISAANNVHGHLDFGYLF